MYKLFIEWLRRKLDLYENEYVCEACEAYKSEISNLRSENRLLLGELLEKCNPIINDENEEIDLTKKLKLPRNNVPWHVRRQELEREDRERAKLIKDAPKPLEAVDKGRTSIEELETTIVEAKVNEG